jgi:hypothetical protein
MDVLSTSGGGISGWVVFATIFFVIMALLFIFAMAASMHDGEYGWAFVCIAFTAAFLLFASLAYADRHEPVRHEVTLRDGGVIDALKYDVIEQRGKVIVIEERKVTK